MNKVIKWYPTISKDDMVVSYNNGDNEYNGWFYKDEDRIVWLDDVNNYVDWFIYVGEKFDMNESEIDQLLYLTIFDFEDPLYCFDIISTDCISDFIEFLRKYNFQLNIENNIKNK